MKKRTQTILGLLAALILVVIVLLVISLVLDNYEGEHKKTVEKITLQLTLPPATRL